MKQWYISDTHFGHFNVINYSKRPFLAKVENDSIIAGKFIFPLEKDKQLDWQIQKASKLWMDSALSENWNNSIAPNDLVYFIGDFAFLGITLMKSILSKLNGYKILVKGNHDLSEKKMKEAGFNEVHSLLKLKILDETVTLCHYPYVDSDLTDFANLRPNIIKFTTDSNKELIKIPSELNYEESKKWLINNLKNPINTTLEKSKDYIIKVQRLISKHIGTRLINNGDILLHGHTHSNKKRFANMINLSVEAWNYCPASLEQIEQLIVEYRKEINGDFLSKENFKNKEYEYYQKMYKAHKVEKFKSISEKIDLYRND